MATSNTSGGTGQIFATQKKVIPKREKIHPAANQAIKSFMEQHAGKFHRNMGRGFKRKTP